MSFFFNDTATTEIYTLSLHDALPISRLGRAVQHGHLVVGLDDAGAVPLVDLPDTHHAEIGELGGPECPHAGDRKSTRLNSSHANISYAVFCLKKKKKHINIQLTHIQY